ncbi:hypothetical protein F66182_6990 [Fusarium sp. NRRL 66182]|nr:hypothetical protein F66182_6990 [Fusarium sp. NRRL 66182]
MASVNSKILLRAGDLLIHQDDGSVSVRCADILIEGNVIAKIDSTIDPGDDTTVIECKGKLISPGFINTHHHVWQTQLKGRHGNHTLLEYLPPGNFIGCLYSVEDAFWGELSGAMEAIDAGTTTVVDHSSLNIGTEYPPTMIQALLTSGIRAVYCSSVPRKLQSRNPLQVVDDYDLSVFSSFQELVDGSPINDRIQLGFVVDNIYLPPATLQAIYSELRASNAKVITTHGVGGVSFNNPPSAAQMLHNAGVLGPDVLISHANFPKDGDASLLAESGAFISSTPNTELQMGIQPVALLPEFEAQSSLGVDCHSCGSGFMPYQMRLLLQHARASRSEQLAADGKWDRHVGPSVEQVFNLGTIGGARAIGMAGEVGQIKVGAKADLLVFGTTSPSMLAAAQENPLSAIVLHSSERDLEAVIVDGTIRKQSGALLPVSVEGAGSKKSPVGLEGKQIRWDDVVTAVLDSRRCIKERSDGIDWVKAEDNLMSVMHLNREALV